VIKKRENKIKPKIGRTRWMRAIFIPFFFMGGTQIITLICKFVKR